MNAATLRKFREDVGLSQLEFAFKLSKALQKTYKKSAIQQWEQGVRPVPHWLPFVLGVNRRKFN